MPSHFILRIIAAAFAAGLLPATAMAAPDGLDRSYALACEIGQNRFSVRNTTSHMIPVSASIWVKIVHKNGAVQSRTVSPLKPIAPGATWSLGFAFANAKSCMASVRLVTNVQNKIQRRPQFGRPAIEKAPKRI